MAGLLPNDIAWRRDKHHVGWQFTRSLLLETCATGKIPAYPPESDWLDEQRMLTATQHPATPQGNGLPAALFTLLWWHNHRQHATLPSGKLGKQS